MSYTVITASRVETQLVRHLEFLARVSIPAAKRFRDEYAAVLARLEENPFRFPLDTDPNLPGGLYRRAIFARRYKVLYMVDGSTVYLDAVVDCGQSLDKTDL